MTSAPSSHGLVSRRTVLGLIAAGGAALIVSGCTPAWHGVEEIGSEYLRLRPEEGSQETLAPYLGYPSALTLPGTMLKNLDAQIIDDFAASRTVMIHGWVLTETEGRIAAHWKLRPAPV